MVTTRRLPYAPTETIVEPTLIQFPTNSRSPTNCSCA